MMKIRKKSDIKYVFKLSNRVRDWLIQDLKFITIYLLLIIILEAFFKLIRSSSRYWKSLKSKLNR